MVTVISVSFVRSMACLLLDNGRKIWLSRSDYAESGWRENSELDENGINQFVLLHQYPHALSKAVSLLAGRPCSKGEIRQNLKRYHYEDEVIEMVLFKLEKEKLLDDREFSDLWVQNRSEKYGPRRIRQELRHKGIAEEYAEEALSSISDDEELDHAVRLARKAWSRVRSGEDRRKSRQKVISSLVRKGFDWDVARQASDQAENSPE